MGNKKFGKEVDRKSKDPVIPLFPWSHFKGINDTKNEEGEVLSTIEFLKQRLEFWEKMEQWGYIWAHWLLEDVFIWPNFDVQ